MSTSTEVTKLDERLAGTEVTVEWFEHDSLAVKIDGNDIVHISDIDEDGSAQAYVFTSTHPYAGVAWSGPVNVFAHDEEQDAAAPVLDASDPQSLDQVAEVLRKHTDCARLVAELLVYLGANSSWAGDVQEAAIEPLVTAARTAGLPDPGQEETQATWARLADVLGLEHDYEPPYVPEDDEQ